MKPASSSGQTLIHVLFGNQRLGSEGLDALEEAHKLLYRPVITFGRLSRKLRQDELRDRDLLGSAVLGNFDLLIKHVAHQGLKPLLLRRSALGIARLTGLIPPCLRRTPVANLFGFPVLRRRRGLAPLDVIHQPPHVIGRGITPLVEFRHVYPSIIAPAKRR